MYSTSFARAPHEQSGLRWLIAPRARQIEVHDLAADKKEIFGVGDRVGSLTVTGFELVLADYFV